MSKEFWYGYIIGWLLIFAGPSIMLTTLSIINMFTRKGEEHE